METTTLKRDVLWQTCHWQTDVLPRTLRERKRTTFQKNFPSPDLSPDTPPPWRDPRAFGTWSRTRWKMLDLRLSVSSVHCAGRGWRRLLAPVAASCQARRWPSRTTCTSPACPWLVAPISCVASSRRALPLSSRAFSTQVIRLLVLCIQLAYVQSGQFDCKPVHLSKARLVLWVWQWPKIDTKRIKIRRLILLFVNKNDTNCLIDVFQMWAVKKWTRRCVLSIVCFGRAVPRCNNFWERTTRPPIGVFYMISVYIVQ